MPAAHQLRVVTSTVAPQTARSPMARATACVVGVPTPLGAHPA
ncbi:MAG TPA: hypothetical protein VHC49_19965 [Mycobacteriales bacterium]|nr:hypothetical protein [Mycobacteriales bacterium]